METTQERREEAYRMGYADSIALTTDDVQEMVDDDPLGTDASQAVRNQFTHYTDGARWCNTVLPHLRRLADYDDRHGKGTYTDGTEMNSWYLEELIEAYKHGWVDKSLGYDRFSSRSDLPAGEDR
jgi:hypothetical protein